MTDQHPITLPHDLIDKWGREAFFADNPYLGYVKAAQWGADQELKACCELLDELPYDGPMLNAARRPKPPSKKEQALEALGRINGYAVSQLTSYTIHDDLAKDIDFLRQLLEGLNND